MFYPSFEGVLIDDASHEDARRIERVFAMRRQGYSLLDFAQRFPIQFPELGLSQQRLDGQEQGAGVGAVVRKPAGGRPSHVGGEKASFEAGYSNDVEGRMLSGGNVFGKDLIEQAHAAWLRKTRFLLRRQGQQVHEVVGKGVFEGQRQKPTVFFIEVA